MSNINLPHFGMSGEFHDVENTPAQTDRINTGSNAITQSAPVSGRDMELTEHFKDFLQELRKTLQPLIDTQNRQYTEVSKKLSTSADTQNQEIADFRKSLQQSTDTQHKDIANLKILLQQSLNAQSNEIARLKEHLPKFSNKTACIVLGVNKTPILP